MLWSGSQLRSRRGFLYMASRQWGWIRISLNLFWNMSVFSDEFNSSPLSIDWGSFWLITDWLRMLFVLAITVLSGINVLKAQLKR
jgi:hypothetical protein